MEKEKSTRSKFFCTCKGGKCNIFLFLGFTNIKKVNKIALLCDIANCYVVLFNPGWYACVYVLYPSCHLSVHCHDHEAAGSVDGWTTKFTHMQQENSSKERLTLAITNFFIIDRVGL